MGWMTREEGIGQTTWGGKAAKKNDNRTLRTKPAIKNPYSQTPDPGAYYCGVQGMELEPHQNEIQV